MTNWREWGPPPIPGILAILAVMSAFLLQWYLTVHYGPASDDMPSWVVSLVSAIVAFYFGQKIGNGGTK